MPNIFDRALNVVGLERKAASSGGGPTWETVLSNGGITPGLSTYNNQKQQLEAYVDWNFSAISTIAQSAAAVDLRLFVNRTPIRNNQLQHRLGYFPHKCAPLFGQPVIPIFADSKGLSVKGYKYATKTEFKQAVKADQRIAKALVTKFGYTKDLITALEEIDNHPMLDVLNHPNPFMTRDEFYEVTYIHMELAGEAFWFKDRPSDNLPPEFLWPLMPNQITPVAHDTDFISGYIMNVQGKQIPLRLEDVVHHKYSNPLDFRRGQSVVTAGARAIDSDSKAADYGRNFFANSAMPRAVLQTEQTLNEDVYHRLRDEFDSRYGGVANAYRTAILEAGITYQPINVTQKDMDFLNTRIFNRDTILAMHKTPKSMVGLNEDVNRAAAETAEYTFTKHNIKPKVQRIASGATQYLAPDWDPKLIVGFTDPVPEDKEFALQEKQASVNSWKPINEVRAAEGDEPIPGGDDIYVNGQLIPLSMANEIAAHNMQEPEAVDTPTGGAESPQDQINESIRRVKERQAEKSKKKVVWTKANRREVGQDFADKRDHIADKFVPKLVKLSRDHFQEQKAEVLKNLAHRLEGKSLKDATRKALADELRNLFDVDKSKRNWASALSPEYQDMIQQMGDVSYDFVSDDGSFDYQTDAIKTFIAGRSDKVSTWLDEETNKQLMASLGEGIQAGESNQELADRVEELYGWNSDYRADRIARTESMESTTFATHEAWDQSGVVDGKQWLALGDSCDICSGVDGDTVSLDDSFDTDDGLVDGPPAHPNCRCTTLPVLSDDSSGDGSSSDDGTDDGSGDGE